MTSRIDFGRVIVSRTSIKGRAILGRTCPRRDTSEG